MMPTSPPAPKSRRHRVLPLLWLLLLAGLSSACPVELPALTQTFQTFTVLPPSGGLFCSKEGLCLQFPSGIVAQNTVLEARAVPADQSGHIGPIFEFRSPQNPPLNASFKVRLPLPANTSPQELRVAAFEDKAWKALPTNIVNNNTFIGTAKQLGRWSLIAANPCASPEVECENTCVDTSTNDQHCGACNNTCSNGQICKSSTCQ